MGKEDKNCANSKKSDSIGSVNNEAPNNDTVPPEERREQVLEFMNEHDIPLPPLAIFAGMKHQYRLTFSHRTVQNILSELVEQDYLIRVDTKRLRDGEIEPVAEDGGRRAYYFITDKGREKLADE